MGIPQFSKDVLELIELLIKYRVEYLLVGGSAVIYYGNPRYTGDVDFFYHSSPENAQRLFAALKEFWQGPIPEVSSYHDLMQVGQIIQFGVPPHRIDLINRIDGVTFEEAIQDVTEEVIEQSGFILPIKIIGKSTLKKNKAASSRPKDLDDLANL
ncbi:MAG: hypothetical protein KDK38_15225 [Leptospiraceae bacterium]|nr:hypothetical protein [Leptospiraceae bacterium]